MHKKTLPKMQFLSHKKTENARKNKDINALIVAMFLRINGGVSQSYLKSFGSSMFIKSKPMNLYQKSTIFHREPLAEKLMR